MSLCSMIISSDPMMEPRGRPLFAITIFAITLTVTGTNRLHGVVPLHLTPTVIFPIRRFSWVV